MFSSIGAFKKSLFLFSVSTASLGFSQESLRCLFVNNEGELQKDQSGIFGALKKVKRKATLLGFETDMLVDALEWEAEFKPSFLNSKEASIKSKFVVSVSNISMGESALQFDGSSEMDLDSELQGKVKRAYALQYIDSANKENQEYGFSLTPEQSEKIVQKYLTKKVEIANSQSELHIYNDQESMLEALVEVMPTYLIKLSEIQKDYLRGKLPEVDAQSREAVELELKQSIDKSEEKAISDSEIALFNLSTDIEENLPKANVLLYLSAIPEIKADGRFGEGLDRLYLCETSEDFKLPLPEKENPPKQSNEEEAPAPSKKKNIPNGLSV